MDLRVVILEADITIAENVGCLWHVCMSVYTGTVLSMRSYMYCIILIQYFCGFTHPPAVKNCNHNAHCKYVVASINCTL